jgi:hypothetical protein
MSEKRYHEHFFWDGGLFYDRIQREGREVTVLQEKHKQQMLITV